MCLSDAEKIAKIVRRHAKQHGPFACVYLAYSGINELLLQSTPERVEYLIQFLNASGCRAPAIAEVVALGLSSYKIGMTANDLCAAWGMAWTPGRGWFHHYSESHFTPVTRVEIMTVLQEKYRALPEFAELSPRGLHAACTIALFFVMLASRKNPQMKVKLMRGNHEPSQHNRTSTESE